MNPSPHIRSRHLLVGLSLHGKATSMYVHSLVLRVFVGPCPDGMECRHLDGNPTNNRLENLEWATYQINQQDRAKHGTSNRGEACAASKLTEKEVLEIREMYPEETMQKLADDHDVSVPTVYDIIHRKTWRHI